MAASKLCCCCTNMLLLQIPHQCPHNHITPRLPQIVGIITSPNIHPVMSAIIQHTWIVHHQITQCFTSHTVRSCLSRPAVQRHSWMAATVCRPHTTTKQGHEDSKHPAMKTMMRRTGMWVESITVGTSVATQLNSSCMTPVNAATGGRCHAAVCAWQQCKGFEGAVALPSVPCSRPLSKITRAGLARRRNPQICFGAAQTSL